MANNDQNTPDTIPVMTPEILNNIIHRWEMSNLFLANYLRRSVETIRSYRYGRIKMPPKMAEKMRRLNNFLSVYD